MDPRANGGQSQALRTLACYLPASGTGLEAAVKKTEYSVVIEQGPTSYGATVPDLPGCFAVGGTREEVARLIEEAITEHISVLQARGEPVPPPTTRVVTVTVG
jgi:predicted RNase H-like HicB family nuclease